MFFGLFGVVMAFSTAMAQTFKSLEYIQSISGKKTIAGQEARQYWGTMKTITGDYPGLWGEDFSFSPWGNTSSMSAWRSLITKEAKLRWNDGALISLMFHACPPTQAEPCNWDGGVISKLTNDEWTELITDGTTLNSNWKARLDKIVPYLQDLKDNQVEVLFRPFHEMNQGLFWWAGRPGANGTAKLFQITHDYLKITKGLTNLVWVWNLQDFSTLSNDLENYDPGSDYWDILALDVYWSDGTGYTSSKYTKILKKAGDKPIAIGECGVLPKSNELMAQPRWAFFMGWSELTQQKNTNAVISEVYNASNVYTLSDMSGWITSGLEKMESSSDDFFVYSNPSVIGDIQLAIELTETKTVCLSIYDLNGGLVDVIENKSLMPGRYLYALKKELNTGIYFARMQTETYSKIEKIVVV